MSSRNADSQASRVAGRRTKRVWSITQRFTLLYVSSTTLLLIMAVGYLNWALVRNMDARDHALVVSKAQVLRLLLRERPDNLDVLRSEIEHESTEGPLRYYLRILDVQGAVVMETPGMDTALPVEWFPPPAPDVPSPPSLEARNVRHHDPFIMLSITTEQGTTHTEPRVLHVALDISTDLALLANYRLRLLGVLGLGVVFAATVGRWLARQGIQPLLLLTRRAQQISASQLHERIEVSKWPAELAELGTAFNSMLDRLADSFDRLSRCTADLAHELRTPINNLRGEAEVALSRSRSTDEYQEILTSSLEEFDRLGRMIEGLLFIARADNPGALVGRIRFDAREEVASVLEFFEPQAEEHQVQVTLEGDAQLSGDSVLFRRAISNVVGNALRHTPEGGSLQVSLTTRADGSTEVGVTDSGKGISAEDLPRVFDRFYRGNRSSAGSGLGLAIVQSIMRLHGGTASLRSEPGQGTTATLFFPPISSRPQAPNMTEL